MEAGRPPLSSQAADGLGTDLVSIASDLELNPFPEHLTHTSDNLSLLYMMPSPTTLVEAGTNEAAGASGISADEAPRGTPADLPSPARDPETCGEQVRQHRSDTAATNCDAR